MMSRSEDGFTIVEAIVALVIIFGAVLVMLRSIDTGARVLYETKRQSGAAALASELMERARSLEWANMGLTVGANSSNCTVPVTSGDPPQGVGCSLFTPDFGSEITAVSGGYEFGGEPVVFATGATFDPFLSFHQQVTRDKTVFDRYLFITSVRTTKSDPATEKYRRITAVVRWNAASGYRQEVRLASYVSPFTEPSLPFISAEVSYDGGYGQVQGRLSGVAGWGLDNGTAGKQEVLASMPAGRLTATSDYVSSAEGRLEGVAGYWSGPGADGDLGTADDVTLLAMDPQVIDVLADDDGTSAAPLEKVLSVAIDLPRFQGTQDGTGIVEIAGSTSQDHTSVRTPGRVAAVDSATDDLPFAAVKARAAGKTVISRAETWDGAPALAYAAALVPLDDPARIYPFTFYRYGDRGQSSALSWDSVVDREDDGTTGLRKATAEFSWDGQELDLLDDAVLSAADNQFNGWVVINLPEIWNGGSYAPLEAGEYYSALTPGIGVQSGDVSIEVWDGSSSSYKSPSFSGGYTDYASLGTGCDSRTTTISENTTLAKDGIPRLRYEVSGTLTINGMCVAATQQYGSGEVRSNSVSATNMVSGTIQYTVFDTVAEGLYSSDKAKLFDLTLTFSTGGVQATAVYINPELS